LYKSYFYCQLAATQTCTVSLTFIHSGVTYRVTGVNNAIAGSHFTALELNMTFESDLEAISATLVEARKAANALPGFPGKLPATFADAYEVQRLSRDCWNDAVVGWKVGGVPPAFIEAAGVTHLVGPIFGKSVQTVARNGSVQMPIFAGGFAAIEPEFVVRLGEIRSEDELFIGAEIASSPLPAINAIGPIAVISDFGNNNGMIVGPQIRGWREQALGLVVVECALDGEQVGSREVPDIVAAADKSIAFLLDHADKHGIDVPVGTYVSTGAITGIHEAEVGTKSRISFGRFGEFSLELVPAQASA
jgi:2-keto-4-pentenoate hydratase